MFSRLEIPESTSIRRTLQPCGQNLKPQLGLRSQRLFWLTDIWPNNKEELAAWVELRELGVPVELPEQGAGVVKVVVAKVDEVAMVKVEVVEVAMVKAAVWDPAEVAV
jgi:hypothetical protein